jgi:hypothetical protein
VLEYDRDAHSSLGEESELAEGQGLARQRLIDPVVVPNDGLDADGFDLGEKILIHLLRSISRYVSLASLAHHSSVAAPRSGRQHD